MAAVIPLVHGEPIRFGVPGANGQGTKGVVRDPVSGGMKVVDIADLDAVDRVADLVVHDKHASDPAAAFALSRLTDDEQLKQVPIGIFREVERPTYDDLAREQLRRAGQGAPAESAEVLERLLAGTETWTVA